jgi:hypothetical protein
MATVSLLCNACDGPVSRYSKTGLCSKCEIADTQAHVDRCISDLENNVHIRHRLYTVFPDLCIQCMKVLPQPINTRGNSQKYCSRKCKYEWNKKNGKPTNAR